LEDSNLHPSVFLEVCDMLKLNGVSSDAIRLRLFPFSLRDKARAWLHNDLGKVDKSFSHQILSPEQDSEPAKLDHQLFAKRR